MSDYDGQILQIINKDANIEELLDQNFLEELNSKFNNEKIKIIPIKLVLMLEEEFEDIHLITLAHKNYIHTINKELIIDVENPEHLDLIVDSLNAMKK